MLKRILIILFAFASLTVSAKSMREIWLSMPDSMVRYLNKSKRIEFLDYVDMKVKTDVKNLLQGSSVMDTITSNYLSAKLNEASAIQMKLLPVHGSDSLLCVVRTYSAPAAESTVNFFSQATGRRHVVRWWAIYRQARYHERAAFCRIKGYDRACYGTSGIVCRLR